MANRGYGYQYETSPRKVELEYKRKPVPNKKVVQNAKNKQSVKKSKISFEVKFFVNSMIVFAVVFAIIALQALVEQRYKEKESLKQEYSELMLKQSSKADSNEDIRVLASEYGMQTKSATLINLETSDYIELSENETNAENDGLIKKFINWIKDLF